MSDRLTAKDLETALPEVQKVLRGLALLPESSDKAGAASQAAIDDFSLAITAKTQTLIKWGTGAGAGAGLISSLVAWAEDASDVVLASVILATALVIAAGLTALARVMDGDVRGRASAGTAAVEARGQVAQTLLTVLTGGEAQAENAGSTLRDEHLLIGLALGKPTVRTGHGEAGLVGAKWQDGKLHLNLDNGDWLTADEVLSFTAKTPAL